jgi:hypothetical protein
MRVSRISSLQSICANILASLKYTKFAEEEEGIEGYFVDDNIATFLFSHFSLNKLISTTTIKFFYDQYSTTEIRGLCRVNLSFNGQQKLTNETLRDLPFHFPKLKSLTLTNCSRFSEFTFSCSGHSSIPLHSPSSSKSPPQSQSHHQSSSDFFTHLYFC